MSKILSNKKVSFLFSLVLIIALGLIVSLALTRQENRNKASVIPSLYFTPSSTSENPLIKNVNDTFTLDLMVDPGNTAASFVTFAIQYDPEKLTVLSEEDVKINIAAFPNLLEGPFVNPASVEGTVSIGSDPTKGITVPTKVASITFKTLGNTAGSITTISHKNYSLILSVGANESASQNVLGLTSPSYIQINVPNSPTPANTNLNINVLLHGIGQSGDNRNPSSELSNKNPLHPQRKTFVEIYNHKNQLTASREAFINYASQSGSFSGVVNAGQLPPGGYIVKIKTEQHLKIQFPGIQNATSGGILNLQTVTLVTGDVNNDNRLDILDYNTLYGCYTSDLMPTPRNCNVANALKADLNDEGKVNLFDLNLFIRELSVQSGL